MSTQILFELGHNRRRLSYYSDLKSKKSGSKLKSLDTWIEIYSDRVKKLERKASRLGLTAAKARTADSSMELRAS